MVRGETNGGSFVPTLAGNEVAQAIYAQPEKTDHEIFEFERQLYDHQMRTGMIRHDPKRAYKQRVHNKLRAVAAPLLYCIEQELAADIKARQEAGLPLVTADDLVVTHFDKRLTNNGKHAFTPEKLHFLRALSVLSHAAAKRFMSDIVNHRNNYRDTFSAFRRLEFEIEHLTYPQPFPMRDEPRERLKDNVVAANVTVMDVLVPLAEHIRVRNPKADIYATLLPKVDQISWAATTKDDFFRRRVGYQYEGAELHDVCPFAHDAASIEQGKVWNPHTLKGPRRVPGLCQEDIPFYYAGRFSTGAELRLAAAVQVARETLWAKLPLH